MGAGHRVRFAAGEPGRDLLVRVLPHSRGAVFDDELGAARDRFAGWAPWASAIVAATTAERLMRHHVYHLPGGLPRYANGRVVFAGDAGHPRRPPGNRVVQRPVQAGAHERASQMLRCAMV
jgi:hypothetical protein